MSYDAQAEARAIVREGCSYCGWSPDDGECQFCQAYIVALAERAYAAGNAAHVEHHRCDRCYAAGVQQERTRVLAMLDAYALPITTVDTGQLWRKSTADSIAAALRAGEGGNQ